MAANAISTHNIQDGKYAPSTSWDCGPANLAAQTALADIDGTYAALRRALRGDLLVRRVETSGERPARSSVTVARHLHPPSSRLGRKLVHHSGVDWSLVRLLAGLYLVAMMFAVGVELGRPEAPKKKKKKHDVRLMAKAIVLNVVIVPALAFAVTRALHASGDVAIALLILSVAPGGAFVPSLVRVAGVELGFAVELILLLAKITCFTAPPTLRWLLSVHHFHFAELPFLLKLLLLQMAPLLVAKWLRRRTQRIEDLYLTARWIGRCTAAILLGLVAVEGGVRGLLYLGDRGWLAVIIVAAGSAALGWLRRSALVGSDQRRGQHQREESRLGPRSGDRHLAACDAAGCLVRCVFGLTLLSYALAWFARRKSHEAVRTGRSLTW